MNDGDQANILMVDDQPGKLLSYEVILKELGENLIQARSAREALDHLLHRDIAVVLMDVSMPEIDGFELADMMRQHPRFQKTAIIFISAVHLTDLDRIKGYKSGAVDYISVPVIPELLRAKVSVFAELHRKNRQLERLNRELEQRVAERTEQLHESEHQFRTLANSIPQLAWMADAQGSIFWYNQRWYDFVGTLPGEMPMWGWRNFQHPDYADRVIQQLERSRSAEEPWEDTFPLLSKEGEYRWFLARAVPIRDSLGNLVRWFGTGTDISAQIAAEEQIRNLNAQLQERVAELEAIMQVLPVGVAVSQDPESTVVTANLARTLPRASIPKTLILSRYIRKVAVSPVWTILCSDPQEPGSTPGVSSLKFNDRMKSPFTSNPVRVLSSIKMAACEERSQHSSMSPTGSVLKIYSGSERISSNWRQKQSLFET